MSRAARIVGSAALVGLVIELRWAWTLLRPYRPRRAR